MTVRCLQLHLNWNLSLHLTLTLSLKGKVGIHNYMVRYSYQSNPRMFGDCRAAAPKNKDSENFAFLLILPIWASTCMNWA